MLSKSKLSDQELIQNYLKGDEIALEHLINKHKSRLFTYIFLLIKDRELAEDVFQDTFMKVIKTLKSGSYNEEGKFLPWVMRISHNLIIDHFRKSGKMRTARSTEEYDIFETLDLLEDNVEDKMVRDQIHQDIRKMIEKLPPEQKEVLMLRAYEDMSFKEISDLTNVSINTALGRMRYAILNLRKMAEKNNIILSM